MCVSSVLPKNVRADKSQRCGDHVPHILQVWTMRYYPEEEIGSEVVFLQPWENDVAIELKSGKRITITNTCAANVLGLIKPEYFEWKCHGRKAIALLADYMGKTVEEVAEQILTRAYEKIEPIIMELAEKYRLEKDQLSVGVYGGAAS